MTDRACGHCEGPLKARQAKYCGMACRNAAYAVRRVCAARGCDQLVRRSENKFCSPEHRAPASRGTCGKGTHPHPGIGERCQLCKDEWEAANRPKEARRVRPQPKSSSCPVVIGRRDRFKAPPPREIPVVTPGGMTVWRPDGITVCPAKGGPDDPRWRTPTEPLP